MAQPVALLTDFGLSDPYVAQMKAVLLGLCPEAAVVDVSHGIEPFNLAQGAFFLEASRPSFAQGTVFVAVVDPGVGTARRIVGVACAGQVFLAPDNGLLGLVLARCPEARAFDLSAHAAGDKVSATFHGRDVFAPLAARLAAGEPLADLGSEIDAGSLVRLPWAVASHDGEELIAHVLHVDRFGNCVLNLGLQDWSSAADGWASPVCRTGRGDVPVVRVRSYAELDRGVVGLMDGSQGFLELAANRASASAILQVQSRDALTLLPQGVCS